ncbi:endonuclease [Deinococcus aquaedulcis]|uniref:endonuclease n=1 Tax=Deinococcus aquaedulcis TaxID=2840455 RepID=UPI001C837134|nr:endonuclease [Deinococcus aquaedulcis]
MTIPPEVLRETQARFETRQAQRRARLQRLDLPGVAADTPERVAARLARVGVPLPDAQALASGEAEPAQVAARLPPGPRQSLERLLGRNDLVGVAYLELARQAADAVARLVLLDARGRPAGYGTGWLCSPQVLVTNHHVLPDPGDARTAQAEFGYELRPDGTLRERVTLALDPDTLFITSEALDYTLVAVRGDTHAYGYLPLLDAPDKHMVGEALSIIQHPGGEPKQVALRENRLVDRLPDFLHYETDTAPGSSGSPVFNDAWEVVALHHSGVPRTDAQGRVLRRDGRPAAPGDPDTELDWMANEGVRISRLIADLRARPEAASPLVSALLNAPRPVRERAGVGGAPGGALNLGTVTPGADGTVSLPVTLSLRVAAPPPTPEDRPYLDPADPGHAAAYYQGIGETLAPAERFAALSALLSRSHTRPLVYDPAQHLYPWVDLWPDGQLRSLYSGRVHSPAELIAADRMAAERRARLAAQEGLSTEALEEALPYNCEHVVPQSWFGRREPMRGDLHHLFACEPACNSFRGNTPYADFPDHDEVVRSDCGRREVGEFEPAAGKGAAARATLYFLLRYPGAVHPYAPRHLDTLLAWHAAQPPGDWERHRNAAIFALQGNRNPLIDHPAWGAGIEFAAGLGR